MLGYDHWATTHSSSPQLNLSDIVDLHHHHHHHRDHAHHNNIIPSSSDHHNHNNNNRPMFIVDHFTNTNPYTFPHENLPPPPQPQPHQNPNTTPFYQNQLLHDPRAYQTASYSNPAHSILTLDSMSGPIGFNHVIPKAEPDLTIRPIGLNLGGRTYFSPDDDLISRLYRRTRSSDMAANTPKCQAERCNADLSNAKHYHRRHKVCDFHSKASTVIAAGLTQRFCQQCSRFHLIAEFDNGKRSCRKRLADHNRRRRKSHQLASQEHRTPPDNARTSPSQTLHMFAGSPTSDSGIISSSSITVVVSPARVSFDSSFMRRLYE